MLRSSLYRILIPVAVAALLVEGCGTTKPSRFYTLNTLHQNGPTPAAQLGPQLRGIGVGPVRIPHYLDRPQIVTRVGTNRFEISEFDR